MTSENNTFYVTTPIFYVNDLPHIGHAYTTVAADILARFNRLAGRKVFFLTGTDEHGQKVEKAASLKGLTPKEHADRMVENFSALWRSLDISNDCFIRTTDAAHQEVVRERLSFLYEKGEIERRTYVGWYCTPCERFWTEKDLLEGKCPDCHRDVEKIEEDNYFFLMSRYHSRLIKHIEENPDYIMPESRRNEVLGFLRTQPLGDLCISRPVSRLSWGVPLPFDEDFVTYVWFDALLNYYSALKYLLPEGLGDANAFWPPSHHLIGKDILTTHAVYWSTMLMAMDMPLPENIFAHGWWTVEGRKMSKSFGNVVDPVKVVECFGADAFRYFLMREVTFGMDGDFSESSLIKRINVDLANDLGNLASRTFKMMEKYTGGTVPEPAAEGGDEENLKEIAAGLYARIEEGLGRLDFQGVLEDIWRMVSALNKYIDTQAPWQLAKKEEDRPRLETVLYFAAEGLRVLSLSLQPFMPEKTRGLWEALVTDGRMDERPLGEALSWGGLRPGTNVRKPGALFPRLDEAELSKKGSACMYDKKEEAPKVDKPVEAKAPQAGAEEKKTEGDNLISIGDFARVVLKTAVVREAERVPKSNKLLRLLVDSGEERQIVAGIGKKYAPEDLLGRTVIVVANLAPAKLMGIESQGMLLAATSEDGEPTIITPETLVPPGLRIK